MDPSTASDTSSTAHPSSSTSTLPQSTSQTLTTSTSPPASSSTTTTSPPLTSAQRLAEAKSAVTASLASVGSTIDSDLQARASDLHYNAASIAAQEADMQRRVDELVKMSGKMKKGVDGSTRKMNELGDAQNWAECLERELLVLEEVVRLKEGGLDGELESGTNGVLRSDG